MSLRLSKHERDRVKKGIQGVRSFDIVDFPEYNILQPGDMLVWDPSGSDGLGFWNTSGSLFGKDISRNLTLIRDNSNNIGALDLKIAETAEIVKNEIINLAPETLDTLGEIAAVLGDTNNIAGSVVNKLTLHENNLAQNNGIKILHDSSLNLLTSNQINLTNRVTKNEQDISTHRSNIVNTVTLIDNQTSLNTTNLTNLTTNMNQINIDVDQFHLDINTNKTNIQTNTDNINNNDDDIQSILTRLGQVDISLNDANIDNETRILDICNNLLRIVNNDNDIANLQNKMTTAESNILNINNNISTNSLNISTNDHDILSLQTRMSTAETIVSTNNNNISNNDTKIGTNLNYITTLQDANFGGRLNGLDISVNQLESTITGISSNLTKINTNVNDINTNKINVATNSSNLQTTNTNLATQTQRLDTLLSGASTSLDTIKELTDVIGDPNGIGSSVITKITNLDASMNHVFNEKNSNDIDIATNALNINNNTVLINEKQPLINTNDLQITYIAGLIDALNTKQDNIGENGLPQSKVSGLANSLTGKQNVIPAGGLSISKVANLQDLLNSKQDVIGEESLPQTKIYNLVASLGEKQDNIGHSDLAISYTHGLQEALDNKQTVIIDDDLNISYVKNLSAQLATKQLNLVAGPKISISNTQIIDTIAAVKLNELNDVKTGGSGLTVEDVEFKNSMLIGTVETGILSQAENNIGIGDMALSSLMAGTNNIAMGIDCLKKLKNHEFNVGIGTHTLQNVAGDGNTAVGYKSGYGILTGENNTLIGRKSDVVLGNNSITNATAIGYNSRVSNSNTIQLGNTSITHVKTNGKLTLGEVTYSNLDGTPGQFLRTDGNGNATFVTFVDHDGILSRLDASMNSTVPAQIANGVQISINKQAIEALVNIDTTTLASINTLNDALNDDFNFANTVIGLLNDRMSKNGNIIENVTGNKIFIDGITIPDGKELTGNSSTTSKFKTNRFINGKLYDGSSDISLSVVDMIDVTQVGSGKIMTDVERDRNVNIEHLANIASQTYENVEIAGASMINKNESISGIKTFSNGIAIPGGANLAGNALTAGKLKIPIQFNGTTFDGSNDIDIKAADLPDIASVGSGEIITLQERTDITTNKNRLNTLLHGADGVLDTIVEIQQALNTNPHFFQTMENSLADKVNKTGNIDEIITGIKTFTSLLKAIDGIEGNVTGDLAGNADTSTKWKTQRHINGHLFDGSVNADLNVVDLLDVTHAGSGKIMTDAERTKLLNINDIISDRIDDQHISNNGAVMTSGNQTISGNINFTNNIVGNVNGNAVSATKLKNPRYIAGQVFDGSNDVSISITDLYDVLDKGSGKVITDDERIKINITYPTKFNQLDSSMNEHKVQINNNNGLLSNIDGNTVKITNENQTIKGTKTFTNLIAGGITGNAETATRLKTGRTIAGNLFDGRNNIDINVVDLIDVTHAGSGKIITDAERNNYENASLECIRKAGNVNETIDGTKTFLNTIIGNLDGHATTATRLEPGCFINGVLVTGGATIDFSATDLTDVTDAGSGKIITDTERLTFNSLTTQSNNNKFDIIDLSHNMNLIIRDRGDILETLDAVSNSTDFVLDVTQQVETIKNLHDDISSNHFALKELHETLRNEHDTLSTSHEDLSGNHSDLKTLHEDLSSNFYSFQSNTQPYDDLQTSHADLSSNFYSFQSDKYDNLQTSHNTLSGNHISLSTSHDILSNHHDNLQESHNLLAIRHQNLNSSHEDISSNYYNFKSTHSSDFSLLSGNHDNLKNLHDTLRTEFNPVNTSHNTLLGNHNNLQGLHDILKSSHEVLQNTVTGLDTKYSDLSNNLYGDFTYTNNKTFTKAIIANGGITIDDGEITIDNGGITIANGGITIANGGITIDNKKYISGDKINYPNPVSATNYTSTDVQTNNDLATILTTLSNNIANLSTALNAIHNKNVLNEETN